MLNCNRPIRQSLQRAKRSQKNIHTASIILKPQDSYSDALYLPLRETMNKRSDNQNTNNQNKKNLDKSIRLDKSPSLKHEKQNRNEASAVKPQYKLKMFNDSGNRIETDRKSLRKSMQKTMKTIRLRTDYQQALESRQKQSSVSHSKPSLTTSTQLNQHQVSTKHTQEYSNKIVYISKGELQKIKVAWKKLHDENLALKKQIGFYWKNQNNSKNSYSNSVLKALNI